MNCKLPLLLVLASAAPAALNAQESAAPAKNVKAGPAPDTAVAVPPGGATAPQKSNTWFPVTERDLGTHFTTETAVGRFEFANPNDKNIEWKNITGSCQCTMAMFSVGDRTYRLTSKPQANTLMRITKGTDGKEIEERVTQIEVGAKERGEIEVHMDLHGVPGPRSAHLDLHTSDPREPQLKISWTAVGAQMFVLAPAEVNLNQMVWNEKRDFTVTVRSPVQKDFNITRMEIPEDDFKVTYEKEVAQGLATWTIRGTYSPHSADVLGGGVLKFFTDTPGQASFQIRVAAAITGPLEVKPGTFLTLGMIRHGTPKVEKVVFESNDGTNLDATAMSFDKLSVAEKFITLKKSKDGNNLIVEVEISAEAPTGLLRGDIVIELNHPAVKNKRIMFNGYVR